MCENKIILNMEEISEELPEKTEVISQREEQQIISHNSKVLGDTLEGNFYIKSYKI